MRLGTTVGRDPVAMMIRSNVRFSAPTAVFVTFTVIVSNLLVDIIYRVLDPRIRYVGDR